MTIGFYQLPSSMQWPAALNMHFLFKEGAANIRYACSSDPIHPIAEQRFTNQEAQQAVALNLSRRITHLVVGILLCLPLINTITYLALQYLQTKKGHIELPQQIEDSAQVLSNSQQPLMETEHSEAPLSEAPLPVQEETVAPSFSDQAVYLPPEMLFTIFSYLDETDLEAAKLVCQDWQAVATDPLLVPPLKRQIQAEVQKARLHLSNCTQCAEGRIGGYWMQLWVDERGSIHALDGHDANTVWLNAETKQKRRIQNIYASGPQDGLYPLEFLVRAADWKPNEQTAFLILDRSNDLPAPIKHIRQLIVDEFNHLANGAEQIARDKGIKDSWNQAWFEVIRSSEHSRSELILASTKKQADQ